MYTTDSPLKATAYYADNVMYLVAVQFEIPGEKWSEFEVSSMYQQLEAYLRTLQTPDKQIERNKMGCTGENEVSLPHSSCLAPHESFWVRVRKLFHDIRTLLLRAEFLTCWK